MEPKSLFPLVDQPITKGDCDMQENTQITSEEAALVRKVLATTGYTAPMRERHEARRIVDRVLPAMAAGKYPGVSDWPN